MNGLAILLFSALLPIQSYAEPLPEVMFTVGDSISAGFVASTFATSYFKNWPSIFSPFVREKDESNFTLDEPTALENSSGPAAIRQFKSRLRIKLAQLPNHEAYSWSSGSKINSQYQMLNAYYQNTHHENQVLSRNVSFSSSRADGLDLQANRILRKWRSGKFSSIAYMTVFIGADDACNDHYQGGTPDALMAQSIKDFFKKISVIEQATPIQVLVVGMPNIPSLAAPGIGDYEVAPGMTCRDLQLNLAHFCDELLDWTDQAGYLVRVESVRRRNQAIRDAVEAASAAMPKKFDVHFTDALFQKKLDIDDLAMDCFHPNSQAQERIAKVLWDEQPWFKSARKAPSSEFGSGVPAIVANELK